ncbi:L-lactate dehydrogenase (cytochrome)/(S)-mandelate dehydrogenase [Mesorhizobium sp. J18]|uniref:alpha-hydroxy acid oxidase n=1 Tax=Mesorhizobium sp. J18 TaxID=935263 RepID=UPI00119942B1|nr:alpha-hydroxy acid oxidase [Mesorhizobium sp. J18]TWG96413.1 L-lactate dehydrogenase (cytochrome)/(S)-mandelate dehydrogenase [Mesorhizobium sp. J18]
MGRDRTAAEIFGHATSLGSIRELARRRLPRGLFEFIDRGSDDEVAIANNVEAFARIKVRPRQITNVSGRTAETSLFGKTIGMPVAIAPTGSAGIVWYKGEMALARAAAAANIPFTLATRSMSSLEEIAGVAGDHLWFQLYLLRDRAKSYEMIDLARARGVKALIITIDTPTDPSREYNARNGYSLPFKYTRRGVIDIATHPRWLLGVIGKYYRNGGLPRFENMPGSPRISEGLSSEAMLCDDITWDDIREIRRRWDGPLMVKGVLHPGDAVLATECGVDAVIVSNHGGRNLDSSIAPIDALPHVVDAVGDRITVLMDGGIRRGSDVAKALALGAKTILIGRPTLYGTAVAGEIGAGHVLSVLRREFLYAMATFGCRRVEELDRDLLYRADVASED